MRFRNFFLKNKSVSWMMCWLLRFAYRASLNEINERKEADIFDYARIARPLPKYFQEIITENNNFGVGFQIRRYANSKAKYLDVLIEHGYFLGSYISFQERYTYASHIFTFGEVRKRHLLNILDKKVTMIGPYIHYADDYLRPEVFQKLKAQLGRTMLVFLAHASSGCKVTYEVDSLVNELEKIRDKFDSIVVSLFWSAVSDQALVNSLLAKNYKIFSAGHRYDPYFLCRLKSMIQLSDHTMSNSFGTHVAYCLYMKKPHWIYEQEIQGISLNTKGEQNMLIGEEITKDPIADFEKCEIVNAFSEFSETLTEKQIEIGNKYFGLGQVKSVSEMKKLLNM